MTNSADLVSCESADIKRRILELIEGASSIAISGHTSPDGDALGSVLGLGLSLMKAFPDKDIALLLADDDPVPRIYRSSGAGFELYGRSRPVYLGGCAGCRASEQLGRRAPPLQTCGVL